MLRIDKESLLKLNDAMRKTIEDLDFNNPEEVCAFASSMISVGNQINIIIIKKICKEMMNNGEDNCE